MTLRDTRNATSLPGSGDGVTPSDSPDGMTLDLFGQEAVPASPSPPPASKRVTQTHVISGPNGFGSSASATLESSLASRLQRQLDGAGSTLYRLTWKRKVTPSGRQYYQLAASALRTNGTDYGSSVPWEKTPSASDGEGGVMDVIRAQREGLNPKCKLRDFAQLAAWPTPNALPENRGGLQSNPEKARERRAQGHMLNLDDAATLATLGPTSSGSPAATAKPGQLNPRFSGWLQGYPPSWDMCAIRVPKKARKRGVK